MDILFVIHLFFFKWALNILGQEPSVIEHPHKYPCHWTLYTTKPCHWTFSQNPVDLENIHEKKLDPGCFHYHNLTEVRLITVNKCQKVYFFKLHTLLANDGNWKTPTCLVLCKFSKHYKMIFVLVYAVL